MGVNIHFVTGHEKDLDLIAAAGFKFVRMDFSWAAIERKKGEYQWAEYDQLLQHIEERGVRALFILDYSNPLYEENGAAPQHPESIAAFAAWAAAAAGHYKGRHVVWEIWNEPNIFFWKPKPDAQQYAALALATCRAVRAADAGATIIGPASSEFPWEFLEAIFKAGLLEHLDAVSVHPYRPPRREPETSASDYQKLRQLMDRYAPEGKRGKIPVISGEWGYSTFTKGVSLETQGAFAARQQLSNLLNGVPISIWYDWKNDGADPAENEHNFGTVLPDLEPKPAYLALKLLARELAGYSVSGRLPLTNEKAWVLVCNNTNGTRKLAAWTTGEPCKVTVRVKGATATLQGTGAGFPKASPESQLELALEAAPQYVTLGRAEVSQ